MWGSTKHDQRHQLDTIAELISLKRASESFYLDTQIKVCYSSNYVIHHHLTRTWFAPRIRSSLTWSHSLGTVICLPFSIHIYYNPP